MKSFIVIALLMTGISALPQQLDEGTGVLYNERFVTDTIASVIEDVSQSIKDVGLDPFYISHSEGGYALPVPVLFNAEGVIEELLFHGLSEIVINSMSFSLITNRLRLNIELPLIEVSCNKADLAVVIFGEEYTAQAAGRLSIRRINVDANVQVSIGIISGISISSMDLDINIGDINSRLAVTVAGYNLSNRINTFIGGTIPETLYKFRSEVNELFEIVGLELINDLIFG